MKLFNYYANNIDKTWYKSSNIVFSECEDIQDDYKKLKVVYSTGRQYLYEDADVRDYISFREAESQGKALNKWLKEKQLKYTRLDDADLEALQEEYAFRSGNGITISNKDKFELLDNQDRILTERETPLNEIELILVQDVLKSVGKVVKVKEEDK